MYWNLLIDKRIIKLITGDTPVVNQTLLGMKLFMPKMSIPDINVFCKKIGVFIDSSLYGKNKYTYMEEVLKESINKKIMNIFFKELIIKERFEYLADHKNFLNDPYHEYGEIVNGLFQRINDYLQFKDAHMEYDLIKYKFKIIKNKVLKSKSSKEIHKEVDYNQLITDFCKDIALNGLKTEWGTIKEIIHSGHEGGNGRILFGKLFEKDVAIKVLYTDSKKKRNRFKLEYMNVVMSLQKITGIVELYIYGECKYNNRDISYIVMKKYDRDLSNYRISNQQDLIVFINHLLQIVKNIHEKGIVHRDIKPENLLFDKNNELVLTDFGAAYYDPDCFENTGHTKDGKFLGNRGFSAPEQLDKNVKPHPTMDIFAFGQIIQFVVTGKPHNGTGRVNVGTKISGDKMSIIDQIIEKCLQVEPSKRYQSAQEIIDIIDELNSDNNDVEKPVKNPLSKEIDENEVYEYICLNDVVSTKQIANYFNYDLDSLKKILKRMYKVKSIIKRASISDNEDEDDCHWMKRF